MISPETSKSLEFDKILSLISDFANSDASKRYILNIEPLFEKDVIEKRFSQIEEIRRLDQEGAPLRFSAFEDISLLIEKIKPEGSLLEPSELLRILVVLQLISSISSHIKDQKTPHNLINLKEMASDLTGFPDIERILSRSIDGDGSISDNGSPDLLHIRRAIRNTEQSIRKKLEEIVRNKRVSIFLQDDYITRRGERWVIPVRMDSKGEVSGVVHDVSRSGETAFIEPIEIIGITNRFENLIADGKAEEIRILKGICHEIRANADLIMAQFRIIVYIDVLNSIALFADSLGLMTPEINNTDVISLSAARHPLLLLQQRSGVIRNVVPLDLFIDNKSRVMVITGPNAGGKTIAIKTTGLLLLMALSGIPISADSSSSLPIVRSLLVDIGDDQSIENSLSTFSAHISNIAKIIEKADSGSIVLLDELGTGTEPLQGAAIACSVLKTLRQRNAIVLATTHLTDIVAFVHKSDGMVNASMEFDGASLTPLYRLRVGFPGQSHAIDIAGKYGIPDEVINFARGLIGESRLELQELLYELKTERDAYEDATLKIEKERELIADKEMDLQKRLKEAEGQRASMLEKAYKEARDFVLTVKREMFDLLQEMKRDKSQEPLKRLDIVQKGIEDGLRKFDKGVSLSINDIKEGDMVFVRSLGCNGEVMRIDKKDNRVRVRTKMSEIELPVTDITMADERTAEGAARENDYAFTAPPVEARYQLNIIGRRVDEALSEIEPFLNHAALAGMGEVVVIHGIGTGALLRATREHLKGHPLVSGFRAGEQSEGGEGATIVRMK
ncbi:MAG: endonuclease MutS2 [Nitrospirae bacterium]|nr:endonuclease MutS2 [Nitrospirota bacterium]